MQQHPTELVQEYQSVGLFGGRHFDTYPWRLSIPLYDSFNEIYQRLTDLAEQCEEIAASIPEGNGGFREIRAEGRKKLEGTGLQENLDETVSELLKLNSKD